MKRKDTKRYQELVDSYIDNRHRCEMRQKDIDGYRVELEKDDSNLLVATVVLKDCGDLAGWVRGLVETRTTVLRSLITLMESNQRHDESEAERYGSILASEYDENLDELYANR